MGYDLKIGQETFNGIEKIKIFDVDDQLRTYTLLSNIIAAGSNFACGFTTPNSDLDVSVTDLKFKPVGFVIMATGGHRAAGIVDAVGKGDDDCGALMYGAYVSDEKINLRFRAVPLYNASTTMRINAGDVPSLFVLNDNGFTLRHSGTAVYKAIKDMEYFWIAWG